MSLLAAGAALLSAGFDYFGNKRAGEAEERGQDRAAALQERALDTSIELGRSRVQASDSALNAILGILGLPSVEPTNFNNLGSSGAGRQAGGFVPGSSLTGEQQRVVNSFSDSFGFDPTLEINRHRILGLDQTTLPSNRLKEDFAAFQAAFGFDPSREEGNPFYDTAVIEQQQQQQQQQAATGVDLNALVEQNPLIQHVRQQGEQAIDRGAAARGLNASGGTLQDLIEFNQGVSSAGINDFVLNPLYQVAGFGPQASSQIGAGVGNANSNLSNLALDRGNTRSSAFQNQGAILSNLGGNLFDIYNNRNRGPDLTSYRGVLTNTPPIAG